MVTNDRHTQLSDSARRELTAERARLQAARDHHESERKKADALLGHVEAILAAANGTAPPIAAMPSRQVGSLREAITAVLTRHPAGMKPADVTRTLEESGYAHGGATSLALSVSNTMWRLEKAGEARRSRKTGKYRLLQGNETEAASE